MDLLNKCQFQLEKILFRFAPNLVISLIVILAVSYILSENEAFAQMESMTIEGLTHPFVNSVFNVSVDVEGVSRASHGIFRTVMTLYEKESGKEITAVPDYLLNGLNTIQINMKSYGNSKSLKASVTYVLKIQHANLISEFEFIPITTINETRIGKSEIVQEGSFIIIEGEKNPRIDSDYNYLIKVQGDLGEDRLLEIFVSTDLGDILIDSWKFSKYDKKLEYTIELDMSQFQWNTEKSYSLVTKIDENVQGFLITPRGLDIESHIAVSEKKVYVKSMMDKPIPDHWIALIEFCSGAEGVLRHPFLQITTDLESFQLELDKLVSRGSCGIQLVDVKAKDPNSITISFVELEGKS